MIRLLQRSQPLQADRTGLPDGVRRHTTRAQSRVIHSALFRVTTVIEQKFFGFEPTSIEGTTVQLSDFEKPLVDCADHPQVLRCPSRTRNRDSNQPREILENRCDAFRQDALKADVIPLMAAFAVQSLGDARKTIDPHRRFSPFSSSYPFPFPMVLHIDDGGGGV